MRVLLRYIVAICLAIASGAFAPRAASCDTPDFLQPLLENVQYSVLANGLRVVMYRRPMAPVFSGVVAVRVGGVNEAVGHTGISHLLEHMAFKGTKEFGTKDYEREKVLLEQLEAIMTSKDVEYLASAAAQEKTAQIYTELRKLWIVDHFGRELALRGAYGLNATTGKELTNYFVSLPKSSFEFWCWIESERILNPVMRQFYEERDVVLEERRMRYDDDPQGKLYEQFLSTVYHTHPYKYPVIGYEEDVRALTATEVDQFRQRFYVPSNMVVSVVGDLDPKQGLEIIKRYFGRVPGGPVPQQPSVQEPPQVGERRTILQQKDASPEIFIGYRKPAYPHPDDPPLSLMLDILAGSSISPLYKQLVKKLQIATDLGYDETPGFAYPNVMLFYAAMRSPYTANDGLEVFDAVLEKFKKNGVTEQDLVRAKRSIKAEYIGALKSNMTLAQNFASSVLIYGDWKAMIDSYKKIMAVNVQDVMRVTNQYLIADARTIGMILKE